MQRHPKRERSAKKAAKFIRKFFGIKSWQNVEVAVVLGTGWGGAISSKSKKLPLSKIPGFRKLGTLSGHSRELDIRYINGRYVAALYGRIHLNEKPASKSIYKMVRLQIEMLIKLGVKKLILTSAVGALIDDIHVGDIVIPDGFVTLYSPDMPLWVGEFCSPEDALDRPLRLLAKSLAGQDLDVHQGGHAMVRGPFFEGRKHDKALILNSGASVVGMSILPECCVAALYDSNDPDEKVIVLPICFVTNNHLEKHSHEENMARAKAKSEKLSAYLAKIIASI